MLLLQVSVHVSLAHIPSIALAGESERRAKLSSRVGFHCTNSLTLNVMLIGYKCLRHLISCHRSIVQMTCMDFFEQ